MTKKNMIASIKAANTRFNKLTKPEKRVAVCKDVIKYLGTEKLKAYTGIYFKAPGIDAFEKPDGSAQITLAKLPSCQVCAKGALFVCTVLKQNQVSNDEFERVDMNSGSDLSSAMKELFSASQLRLIETEFEGRDMECEWRSCPIAPKMGLMHYTPTERLIKIMENIIANKGTFKPKAPK
jgi:hypothetical protein